MHMHSSSQAQAHPPEPEPAPGPEPTPAQVLLAVIAMACLVSGFLGQQRMDRLAAALGFKATKEADTDK